MFESWYFFSPSSFCLMCGNGEGLVYFLCIVFKSPPAFPK